MCKVLPAEASSPAFVILKGGKLSPITYSMFLRKIKELCQKAGLDPKGYSAHSFRRGGASFAFRAGVPAELIKIHGDWASHCFEKYLSFNMKDRLKFSGLMAKSIGFL